MSRSDYSVPQDSVLGPPYVLRADDLRPNVYFLQLMCAPVHSRYVNRFGNLVAYIFIYFTSKMRKADVIDSGRVR